jgi:hypothetical protein
MRVLGFSQEETLGRRCCDVMRGLDVSGNLLCYPGCQVMVLNANEQPIRRFHMRTRRKDGQEIWIEISTIIVPADGNRPGGTVHLFRHTDSDPKEQLQVLILNHFEYFLSHVEAMKVVSHEAAMLRGEYELRVAEIKRQYYLRSQQIVQSILGDPNADSVRLRTTTLALFEMINWVYTWYRPGRDDDAKGLADCMTQLFVHGLASQRQPCGEQEVIYDG